MGNVPVCPQDKFFSSESHPVDQKFFVTGKNEVKMCFKSGYRTSTGM